MVEAVKRGFPQREIADATFWLQQEIDSGRRVVVGVNRLTEGDEGETSILRIDPALETKQIKRVQTARAGRDHAAVERALDAITAAARTDTNLTPLLIEAARAHVTEGEIVHALRRCGATTASSPPSEPQPRASVAKKETR
jgi:methylmalonyl-CoA mutase N-terminal domain/subunit